MQQWIDKTTQPIEVLASDNVKPEDKDKVEATLASMKEQAQDPELVTAVRTFLDREFIPGVGLKAKDVLRTIMAEEQERLTDIPYGLREAEKQRWIAEQWPYDKFQGMVSDTWRRWKTDFSDEGPDPMAWGEKMRRMHTNKGTAEREYRQKLHDRIFAMFEDTERYGPTWALAAARELRTALAFLKDLFLNEAADPLAIATLMGDVYLINATSGGQGPSLSAIIETRIGKEFDELDKAVKGLLPFKKRDRVEREAYEYLTWCAHWCRARIEERARRLTADMLSSLINALIDLERELLDYAGLLARLQSDLLKLAKEWGQKALTTENIGELLYNPVLLKAMDVKIGERQGDRYDPARVANQALQKLGRSLKDLRQDEVPRLLEALLAAAAEAIGDLDEQRLQDTRFAAHDLLSAQFSDDNALDQKLRQTIQSGSPFVMLNPLPPGGNWVPGSDLLEIAGAGLRGGNVPPEQDQDRERARVVSSLKRVGFDAVNGLQPIDDSSQIVFFQECGGFPLRALHGIEEMKQAYEEHRRQGGPPLHIVRDKMAERYPDLLPPPPDLLERALTLQAVALPLGFIAPRAFPHPDGSGRTLTLYSYLRHIPELGEQQPVPIGETTESVGLKLAFQPALTQEIEKAVDARLGAASPEEKGEFAQKLKQYLVDFRDKLKSQAVGADPEGIPAYQQERDRVVAFMRRYGLSSR